MLFKDMPIQKKLVRIIFLISGAVLLVTCITFFVYEFYAFRKRTIEKLSTIGKIIAANSTATLAFDDRDGAKEILAALKTEPHIVAAALYDEKGNLFSQYPVNMAINNFPASPGRIGFHFSQTHLEGFQPLKEGTKRFGTLYLKSDLEAIYERFRLYGIITILAIALSLLLAYLLSKILQKSISNPILALAETAKTISVNRDYSLRAVKSGDDEMGSLTDSFNNMLGKIHEQNQALGEFNEELARNEKKYRYLFENSPMPMWVIDLNTFKFLDVNEMAILQYGYSREEFLSMTTLDIRPDEDKELFKQPDHLFEMSRTNYSKGIWNHRKKDGTIIQVETIGHKIIFEGVTARLILSNDVTEKKKAEEKLEQSEKLFRAMIEKDADMKTLTTPDGKVFYASPSITKILGYENQEFITTSAFELIHPDDVPGFIEGVTDIVQTPGKSFYCQQRLKHKNGTWLWCEGTITNMLHEPAVAALVSNSRDITERKKFEEAQALFASIVNSSDDAIFTRTLEGIITSWNHGAEKTFGYSSNEIIGKHNFILIPPHLQNEENEIMEKIHKGEDVDQYETERIKKDGKVIYVSQTISPIKDSLGNIIGASKISRDITERKKTEEELIKSEKQYRNLFENNPMPMWVINLTTFKFLDVNEAAISHYGYSREEFLSMTALDIRPEEEKERYKNDDHSENIYPANYNRGIWKHLKKDGTVIYVEIIVHKIVFEGKTARLVLSNDVTEKIKAEGEIQKLNEELEQKVIDRTAKLQKSNELFSNLFNLNPASIAIGSIIDGKLIDVNDAFLLLNGYSFKEEVVGKTIAELNMAVQPEQRAEIVRLLKENKYIKNLEINIYDNQGNKKWIQLSAIMLEIDNVPCLFSVSIDITERKKVEEQLQAVNTELESFSYSVSHDLRAPLRAVSGYARILEEDYKNVFDKEANRLLGIIQENANKMGVLIDDLLAFSKLGKEVVNGSLINMTKLTESIFSEINKTSGYKAIVKINSLYPVMADYSLINQVMMNLISNAIKYSSGTEKSSIEIKSEKKDGELIYSISDNGAGFDMQYAHKLFGVFQRLHSAEEFEGTGVGLAIVKRIINKHNGRVWAKGEPGKGATFYFSLPDYEIIKNN